MKLRHVLAVLAGLAFAAQAWAQLLTEKKFFTLPQYTTAGGKTIKNVRVGYETYGKLNAAGDNAIFVPHFFSGNSHAAGRYKADEKAAGYWDAIIGSGKAIDTDKYFVVSADTLVNLNVKSPMVGTNGPATINPDTGKPYGSTFPVVSIRDFVRVHKALLDSLGVKRLQAAAGASMGSLQAMQWAAEYPGYVERVVHVIGPGLDIHPYTIEMTNAWAAPIKLDPNWKGGDYYGGAEPNAGLAQALTLVSLTTLHFAWAEKVHGYKWAAEGKDPGEAMDNLFAIEDSLQKSGQARAGSSDAGHFVWLVKANQLYNLEKEQARIKAKVLFLPAKTDLVFPPELSKRWADKLRAQGNHVELYEIDGTSGHLDGIFSIGKVADQIKVFLTK
ncbi:homoserine acetyltransferase [Betaproteobacteria bacterium SCGC AG-212-J23]|nr:homoserine acetyltransferase [Betaproteobacteria bacterium SCGC AG-212-J23]